LTKEQKELGSLVIDLGGGTTDFTVSVNGIIKHTGVLAVGGDHVTNDLAIGLKIALGRAEGLKLEHGSALPDEAGRGQTISIPGEVGLPAKSVNLDHLRRIMNLRLEEIFQLIGQDLERADMLQHLRDGIFICGGGARIPGIAKLAQRVFDLPVSIGRTNSVSGIKSALDQPEFAAAIGLVKFGSVQQRRRAGTGFLGKVFKRVLSGVGA
jgi:cell division protein FtsA